ncbi:MAG: hypothetical protein CM1200mP41_26690 [Gammaproteobacteria bacterium]|nr:MAG: hypothetical protein CM1200mP41_26690 [Gammaproteobacteria bacterium]
MSLWHGGISSRLLACDRGGDEVFYPRALASGVLLYGMSLLYGLTGSLQISEVRAAMRNFHLMTKP